MLAISSDKLKQENRLKQSTHINISKQENHVLAKKIYVFIFAWGVHGWFLVMVLIRLSCFDLVKWVYVKKFKTEK